MNELEAIYREHYAYVLNVCRRMVKSAEDAEDLAQEVFVHLASVPRGRSLPRYTQFRGQAKFRTWLHRLTANLCLMALRRQKKQPVLSSLDQQIEVQDEPLKIEHPAAPAPDPCLRVVLSEALDQLAPGYRMVLVLRYVEGMSLDEAAQAIGYTGGCARSQSHRALKRMRQELAL